MHRYGIIGDKLAHSFSPGYFAEFFKERGLADHLYDRYEIAHDSDLESWLDAHVYLHGFNITKPYKKAIIPFLSDLTPVARAIGAVNTVRRSNNAWIGHNTDGQAFLDSLVDFIPQDYNSPALILGNGGAAAAVRWALDQVQIPYLTISRNSTLDYHHIDSRLINASRLIINTTPLGMYPHSAESPPIPYNLLNNEYFLYDLIYNPENTLFLNYGSMQGAKTKNGIDMLYRQARLSWDFWTDK